MTYFIEKEIGLVRICVLISCLLFGLSKVGAQKGNFTLSIKVTDPIPGYKAYLYYKTGSKDEVDSGIYLNGNFEIKGRTEHPQKASVCLATKTNGVQHDVTKQQIFIYLEEGHILVSGYKELKSARISGTLLNNVYQGYLDVLASLKPYKDSLSNEYGQARQKHDTAALRKLTADFKEFDAKERLAEERFFMGHPNSKVSLDWLKTNINVVNEKRKAIELFGKLDKNLRNSLAGKEYGQFLVSTQTVNIGNKAPGFTTKNVKGENVSLSSFQGKYVLLDFWASWCGPCRKENPNVLKAYDAFKSKSFTVVSFSLDGSKKSWLLAVEKDALPWTQLSDLLANDSPVVNLYGIIGIPSNFLIDPRGKIIAKNLRGDDLEKELQKIFN